MMLPDEIKIGSTTWRIFFVSDEALSGSCGDSNRKTQTIRINREMPQEAQEVTFFHEALHAVCTELNHPLVETLGVLLHQVFSHVNKVKRQKK